MEHILVTGGAGFLGSHLCDLLLARGCRVTAMDNLITGNVNNIAHNAGNPNFSFIKYDVTNYLYLESHVDAVFHFASPASPIDYQQLPIQTLKVGSLGTHKALGLALAEKAVFLLASTSEVYGDPLVHPQTEDYWGNVNPIGPRGVYDEAKRFSEALTMAYHNAHGLDTRIVRIFNTYGPRMQAARRPGGPGTHLPGAHGPAAHGLRRRIADPQLLLRQRPCGRNLPALQVRLRGTGEYRQPRGDDGARVCRDSDQR